MKKNVVSIVFVWHRSDDEERTAVSKKSLISLIENTTYPYELILVDNTQNNLGAAKGRNWGAMQAHGDYICFTDDDIYFLPNWLEECVEMIDTVCGKYIATPVHQPRLKKWEFQPIMGWRVNDRAGSNCMVMKKESFDEIGIFDPSLSPRLFGGEYCDRQVHLGYKCLITREPKAIDLCFKRHSYVE